jgi:hypothetical protein
LSPGCCLAPCFPLDSLCSLARSKLPSSTCSYLLGRPDLNFDTAKPNFGTPCRNFGTPDLNFDTAKPNFGTPCRNFGTPDLNFDTSKPNFGTPCRNFGTPDLNFDTAKPNFGTPCRNFGTPDLNFDTSKPNFGTPCRSFETSFRRVLRTGSYAITQGITMTYVMLNPQASHRGSSGRSRLSHAEMTALSTL